MSIIYFFLKLFIGSPGLKSFGQMISRLRPRQKLWTFSHFDLGIKRVIVKNLTIVHLSVLLLFCFKFKVLLSNHIQEMTDNGFFSKDTLK